MNWPRITVRVLAYLIVLSCQLIARKSTDVIVMNNGDRFTGTIKRLEAGVLYVGLDYVDGDISIDWKKVARIESKQLFIVQTQEGTVLTGEIATAVPPDAGQPQLQILETEEPQQPVVMEMSRVVNLRQTSEDFLKRWSGEIGAGVSYSKGNNATQYNFNFDPRYLRRSLRSIRISRSSPLPR
jgi:hypothetical protein